MSPTSMRSLFILHIALLPATCYSKAFDLIYKYGEEEERRCFDDGSRASRDLGVFWRFHHAIRGAERSLVRVLLSFTPFRMATSMFPPSCSAAPSPASL